MHSAAVVFISFALKPYVVPFITHRRDVDIREQRNEVLARVSGLFAFEPLYVALLGEEHRDTFLLASFRSGSNHRFQAFGHMRQVEIGVIRFTYLAYRPQLQLIDRHVRKENVKVR